MCHDQFVHDRDAIDSTRLDVRIPLSESRTKKISSIYIKLKKVVDVLRNRYGTTLSEYFE